MTPRQRPRFVSSWDLAALAGLLALAVFYRMILPHLPDPVPTHFTALGRANGWTPKASLAWVVFTPPLALWAVLFLVGALVGLAPGGLGRAAVQPLRGLMGLGLCLLMGGCLLVPALGLAALYAGLAALFACMGLGLALLVRAAWAELARLPAGRHYRYGLFYVNREDPRLWVAKAIGYGWTLNFAHPAAYAVMLALAAVMVALGVAIRAAVR